MRGPVRRFGVCVEGWFSAALKVEGSIAQSRQLHGHDYRVRLCVETKTLLDGFVVDHYLLSSLLRSCIEPLDHRILNSVIEPPTTEKIADYVASCMGEALRRATGGRVLVSRVEVCTGNSLCGYVDVPDGGAR